MGRLAIVGVGPGPEKWLVPEAKRAIEEAAVLAGGPRHLAPYRASGKELLPLEGPLAPFLDRLKEAAKRAPTALLLSGDPCFFSLLGRLSEGFSPDEYVVFPGVSSFQLLFARLGAQWHDVEIASLHGRPLEASLGSLREDRGTLFLLDSQNTPRAAAAFLKGKGCPDRPVVVGENLGYDGERITKTTLFDLAEGGAFDGLSLLLLSPGPLPPEALGVLPDQWFLRDGAVPLSKEVCRAMVSSLLHPLEGRSVLEVGSGSGGITVELARRVGGGKVFAVERSPEALEVARRNAERGGCSSAVQWVEGSAPEALAPLPLCHRAVVGGHGGNPEEIIRAAWDKLLPGGRLLATANMPSTAHCAWRTLKALGAPPEVIHLAASRSAEAGDSWMLRGDNPVFIIYSNKDGTCHGRK